MTARAVDRLHPTAAAPAGPPGLLTARADGERLGIWDHACRRCPACTAGFPTACLDPVAPPASGTGGSAPPADGPAPGDRWQWRADGAPFAEDRTALTAAAATHDLLHRSSIAAPAVLVLGAGPVGRAVVAAASGAGATAVVWSSVDATDPAAPAPTDGPVSDLQARARLADAAASGRADVVLAADGDLALAARLVRRGGVIASVVPTVRRPSVTTIVQRELELPTPRDLVRAAVDCRLPDPSVPAPRTSQGAHHGQ